MNTNHPPVLSAECQWWEDRHPALHVPRGGSEEAVRQAGGRLVHRGPPPHPPIRHSPLPGDQGGTLPDNMRGQVVPEHLSMAVHQRPRQGPRQADAHPQLRGQDHRGGGSQPPVGEGEGEVRSQDPPARDC